jgi:POT family proton-dependent oligopeptide transporter
MQSSVNQKESRTFFGHPYPLGSLFFTEMWERFSFYGIRPLLILFMAATVYDGGMGLARENASAIVGIFAGTMYLAALPGGWLADNWLGQQRAVWYGSILIALGHLSIALGHDGQQPVLYRPDVHRARLRAVQNLYLGDGRYPV